MNYRIEAIDVLLNEDCIPERYYPLIPFKFPLVQYLKAQGIYSKDDCLVYFDEAAAFFEDDGKKSLLRRFLSMYDNSSKLSELKKLSLSQEETDSFKELYLLPGVKETRARLYFQAGFRTFHDIADADSEVIIGRCREVIDKNSLCCAVPLSKEVKTHIAVSKVYTYYREPCFEGILICSDFDGTLYCGYIPERNMKAIKYFTDRGGIFTLVSGRNGKDIANGRFPIPVHTVMAGLNGTQIYDVPGKKLIEQTEIGDCGRELVREILDALPEIRKMDIVSERGRITVDLNDTELYRQLMVDGYQPIYKAVFYIDTEGENFFPEIAVKICEGRALVSSNGYGGFEITAPGASKGRAAKILKELTNAKTLICIGDFQSDVSMLKIADRSFAPSSASQTARNAATDIVCPVNDGVMGDVVEILSDDAGKISKENTKQISFNYSRGYSL